jgi:LAO/AO transport system kinase
MEDWLLRLQNKDKRTIAQIISKVENREPQREEIIEQLQLCAGDAYIIGITGPPGAGKSTLIGSVLSLLRGQGLTVGVLAIDPTSPFSGGAILGDRVRMNRHATDDGVYLRSMASRGNVGGLSRSTKESVRVLSAAGFDVILIETVGVGQAELDIMHLADTVCVVLHPGAGDMVQVTKAGVMEIADLYVVNKADHTGSKRLIAEIEDMVSLSGEKKGWTPTVISTIARENKGMTELWSTIEKHRLYLKQTGEWDRQRADHLRQAVWEELTEQFQFRLTKLQKDQVFQQALGRVTRGEISPHQFAGQWASKLFVQK